MAQKKYIIAIDSGTQSVRAIMFDANGNEISGAQEELEPYFSNKPGWAEQDPGDYWSKLCVVTNKIMKKASVDPALIAGVGLTSQRTTFIAVDKKGSPLRPAIVWLDQRTVETPPTLSFAGKAVFTIPGIGSLLNYVRKNSKYLWMKINEPELYRKTAKFLLITGWFVKKLTGEFRESKGMVNTLWPIDLKHFRWYTSNVIFEAFGLLPRHLPELCDQDQVLGVITPSAAQETGLPEGLPVVVGGGDKQSELLGAGGSDPGAGVISFGTGTSLEIMSRKYVSDRSWRYFAWPGAIPDTWSIETYINRGFWMVTWFKNEFGYRELKIAQKRGIAPEAVLDELIESVPPGSMGLMLQPHWSPLPDSKYAKGSIIGFGDVHTRAHIYRAILEGLGYELRRLYDAVSAGTGIILKELRVGGGGSRSDAAVQIAADIFNLPVSRVGTSETCALGAAINTAVATGLYRTFDEAVASMVRKGKIFYPDPDRHLVYNALYRDVYCKTYTKLEPLYKRIAEITGYPYIK